MDSPNLALCYVRGWCPCIEGLWKNVQEVKDVKPQNTHSLSHIQKSLPLTLSKCVRVSGGETKIGVCEPRFCASLFIVASPCARRLGGSRFMVLVPVFVVASM